MVCPRCAAIVAATDNFCENCGFPLSGAPAEGATPVEQMCNCPPGQSKPDEDGYCQVCGIRCVPRADHSGKHVEVAIDDRLAYVSDIGRRHPTNEDAAAVARGPGESVILIVADGVTTSSNAASASRAAVEAALNVALVAHAETPLTDVARSAVEAANQATLALPYGGGAEDGPETTIVMAMARGGRMAIGWAGDSRAYLVGPNGTEILTVDDSWVEDVVRSGAMNREQAESDMRAHMVTQVLGMRDQQLVAHVVEREAPENHILLLCSDGLWNYFERDGELAAAVSGQDSGDALSLCRWLVDAANERGGRDNVTAAALIEPLK